MANRIVISSRCLLASVAVAKNLVMKRGEVRPGKKDQSVLSIPSVLYFLYQRPFHLLLISRHDGGNWWKEERW
jgi:hypothetical protein